MKYGTRPFSQLIYGSDSGTIYREYKLRFRLFSLLFIQHQLRFRLFSLIFAQYRLRYDLFGKIGLYWKPLKRVKGDIWRRKPRLGAVYGCIKYGTRKYGAFLYNKIKKIR